MEYTTINPELANAADQIEAMADQVLKAYSAEDVTIGMHYLLKNEVLFCNFRRDGSHLDKLWNRLPGTVNKHRIRDWLRAFTGWDIREDRNGVAKFLSRLANGEKAFFYNIEGDKTPFYVYKAVNNTEDKPWDASEGLKKWLDSAHKKVKQGKVNEFGQELVKEASRRLSGIEEAVKQTMAAKAAAKREQPQQIAPQAPALAA